MYSAFRCGAIAALVGFFLGNPEIKGDLIAYWDFNDSNLTVDFGTGTLSTNFPANDVGFLAGTTKNARTGVAAGQALRLEDQINNSTGRLDFAINTSGYRGLSFSLATQKTSSGFNSNQLWYSANGGTNFSSFGSPFNPPTSFDTFTFDLSGVTSLENNPDAILRLMFGGATSATGNNRIDNVQITANAVATPEPATWTLAGVAGALTMVGRLLKRRRSRCQVSGVRCQQEEVVS